MKNLIAKKEPLLVFGLWAISYSASAQGDHIDSSGKLYAVVACVAIIIVGIVLFLFYLERRITRVESQNQLDK